MGKLKQDSIRTRLSHAAIFLLIAGCESDDPPAEVDAVACPADAAWLTQPSFPTEIPAPKTKCEFRQFAWQDFLALTQPTDSNALLFEKYMPKKGVFDPSAIDAAQGDEPFPWETPLPIADGCPTEGLPEFGPTQLRADLQAGNNAGPLVDQTGRWLQFGIRMNETAYNYLTACNLYKIGCFDAGVAAETISFPNQSILLKTSWRIVDEREAERTPPRYYIARALVDPLGPTEEERGCHAAWVALVGFHIVHKTPDHQEWIWATFEHRDVAPDCADIGQEPPGGWLLYDPDCQGPRCKENRFNNPCATNACSEITSFQCGVDLQNTCEEVTTCISVEACAGCYDATCEKEPIPTQACRDFPVGWTLDDDGNGTVSPYVAVLNANMHKMLAEQGSVWQHYRLIDTLGCASPPQPGNLQCSKTGPLQNSVQAGALALSNMTMETYNQKDKGGDLSLTVFSGEFLPEVEP